MTYYQDLGRRILVWTLVFSVFSAEAQLMKKSHEIRIEDSLRRNGTIVKMPYWDSLVIETKQIMKKLNIPIRKNCHLDGKIIPYEYEQSRGFMMMWRPIEIENYNLDSTEFYYPEAWILIRSKVAKILSAILMTDTTMESYKSRSAVIHELTHHFQVHSPDGSERARTRDEIQNHMSKPSELEAEAVAAYYFLMRVKPEVVEPSIQTPAIHKFLIFARLINHKVAIVNPNQTISGE